MLNAWIKKDDNFNAVDKHDERIGIEENWACGVRTTGHHEKNALKLSCL